MKTISILAPFLFVGILLYQSCYLQNGKTSFSHTCNDLTHNTCNNSCECNGFEYPSIELSDNYLEFYTVEDIYYIYYNDLVINTESGKYNIQFHNIQELKEWLSDISVQDSKPCYDMLYNN